MYKVCEVIDDRYYSSGNCYSVEYKIGEKTYPKLANSKLFLFSELEYANNFACSSSIAEKLAIFKCEAENPKEKYPIDVAFCVEDPYNSIHNYWNGLNRYNNYKLKYIIGCLCADSITILYKV